MKNMHQCKSALAKAAYHSDYHIVVYKFFNYFEVLDDHFVMKKILSEFELDLVTVLCAFATQNKNVKSDDAFVCIINTTQIFFLLKSSSLNK